jgi:hypothetical protein
MTSQFARQPLATAAKTLSSNKDHHITPQPNLHSTPQTPAA